MDFMMSVSENMEMQVFGGIVFNVLIVLDWRP